MALLVDLALLRFGRTIEIQMEERDSDGRPVNRLAALLEIEEPRPAQRFGKLAGRARKVPASER